MVATKKKTQLALVPENDIHISLQAGCDVHANDYKIAWELFAQKVRRSLADVHGVIKKSDIWCAVECDDCFDLFGTFTIEARAWVGQSNGQWKVTKAED